MARGVALLVGFLVRQATAANPLMPLRVFRSRDVSAANLIQMSLVAGLFGVFFLGALYLEHVLALRPDPDRARLPAAGARASR